MSGAAGLLPVPHGAPNAGRCPRWRYNPTWAAAFSLNKVPLLMYPRITGSDRCPVWFMIDRSLTPASAAEVGQASPKRVGSVAIGVEPDRSGVGLKLDQPVHRHRRQSASVRRVEAAVAIDGQKHRARGDASLLHPRIQRPHRTGQ